MGGKGPWLGVTKRGRTSGLENGNLLEIDSLGIEVHVRVPTAVMRIIIRTGVLIGTMRNQMRIGIDDRIGDGMVVGEDG